MRRRTLRFQPAVEPWGRTIHWPMLAGIVSVLVLGILGYVFRATLFSPSHDKRSLGLRSPWRFCPLGMLPGTQFRLAGAEFGGYA